MNVFFFKFKFLISCILAKITYDMLIIKSDMLCVYTILYVRYVFLIIRPKSPGFL